MGSRWASVSLPPVPIRRADPEQAAATAAMVEAHLARTLHAAELRAKRKQRTTVEQRERRASQDDVRKLRALLREAADAARWARIETMLDGLTAYEHRAAAGALRDKVKQRTAKVYAKAAAGCMVSAAFIADDSADELYREVFNAPAG